MTVRRFTGWACCLLLIQGCAVHDDGAVKADRVHASTSGTYLHSPELAFSITVQQPWQIQVKDARLLDQQQISPKQSVPARISQSSEPLLVVSIPDGKTRVPPTIQVNYQKNAAAEQADPVALLEQQLFYLRAAYQQFSYLTEPVRVHTHAHAAACAQFETQSDIEINGELQEDLVMMKFCLIPRGDLMFMIAMAADTQLFPTYLPSFDAMLESVRL